MDDTLASFLTGAFTVLFLFAFTIQFSLLLLPLHNNDQSSTSSSFLASLLYLTALSLTLGISILVAFDVFFVSLPKQGDRDYRPIHSEDDDEEEEFTLRMVKTITDSYHVLYSIVLVLLLIVLPVVLSPQDPEEPPPPPPSPLHSVLLLFILFGLPIIQAFHKNEDYNLSSYDLCVLLLSEIFWFICYGFHLVGVMLMGLAALTAAMGMASLPLEVIMTGRRKIEGDNKVKTLLHENVEQQLKEDREVRRWIRPLRIIFGSLLALFSLLIFTSLLLNAVDKHLNSTSGFLLKNGSTLPNPLDSILVYAQDHLFPLDYLLYLLTVQYIISCSVHSIKNCSILDELLEKKRISKTDPREFVFKCMSLLFVILAINPLMFSVAPDYMTFGSQHFATKETVNNVTTEVARRCQSSLETIPADCAVSRIAHLYLSFHSSSYCFGVVYYCFQWAFLIAVVGEFDRSLYGVGKVFVLSYSVNDNEEKQEEEEEEQEKKEEEEMQKSINSIPLVEGGEEHEGGGVGASKEKNCN